VSDVESDDAKFKIAANCAVNNPTIRGNGSQLKTNECDAQAQHQVQVRCYGGGLVNWATQDRGDLKRPFAGRNPGRGFGRVLSRFASRYPATGLINSSHSGKGAQYTKFFLSF
jgi:hypothetical protein